MTPDRAERDAAASPARLRRIDGELASQARLALKALAFLAPRDGDEASARPYLDKLLGLDPEDGGGARRARRRRLPRQRLATSGRR